MNNYNNKPKRANLGANIVSGGILAPIAALGNKLYYKVIANQPNKTDSVYIGPNNKTGLAVDNNEIIETKGNNIRVASADLGTANLIERLAGRFGLEQAFNKGFTMQEQYKKEHKLNDDGTRRARLDIKDDGNDIIRQAIKDADKARKSHKPFDSGIKGFIPFIGDGLQALEAGYQAMEGNIGNAALNAGLLVLPNTIEKILPKNLIKKGISKINKELTEEIYKVLGRETNTIDKNIGSLTKEQISKLPEHYKAIYQSLKDNNVDITNISEDDLWRLYRARNRNLETYNGKHNIVIPDTKTEGSFHILGKNENGDNIGYMQVFSPNKDYDKYSDAFNIGYVDNLTTSPRYFTINGENVELPPKDIIAHGVQQQMSDAAINLSKEKGLKGIVSGEILETPEATEKMWTKYKDKVQIGNWGKRHYHGDIPINKTNQPVYLLQTPVENIPTKSFEYIEGFPFQYDATRLKNGEYQILPDGIYKQYGGTNNAKYGGIRIKSKNKGKFSAAAKKAGMSTQSYADYVLRNRNRFTDTIIKRAIFAKNAAKWKHHSLGGYDKALFGKQTYRNWSKQISNYKGIDVKHDKTYDYKGFYNENPDAAYAMLNDAPDAHFTDKYKTALHPTFSDESIYSNDKTKGGHWVKDVNGNWEFQHSDYTMKHSDETNEYLRNNDPTAYATYRGGIVLDGAKHGVADLKAKLLAPFYNGTFDEAFAKARTKEKDYFRWKGDLYNTRLAPDVKEKELKVKQIPSIYFINDDNELAARQRWAESANNNSAKSPRGALGPYQIMPATLKEYQDTTGDIGDVFDLTYSKKVRDHVLNQISKSYAVKNEQNKDYVRLAKQYAAYNWGIGNLSKKLQSLKESGMDIYNTLDWIAELPKETRDYVNFIIFGKDTGGHRTNEKYNNARKLMANKHKLGGRDKLTMMILPTGKRKRAVYGTDGWDRNARNIVWYDNDNYEVIDEGLNYAARNNDNMIKLLNDYSSAMYYDPRMFDTYGFNGPQQIGIRPAIINGERNYNGGRLNPAVISARRNFDGGELNPAIIRAFNNKTYNDGQLKPAVIRANNSDEDIANTFYYDYDGFDLYGFNGPRKADINPAVITAQRTIKSDIEPAIITTTRNNNKRNNYTPITTQVTPNVVRKQYDILPRITTPDSLIGKAVAGMQPATKSASIGYTPSAWVQTSPYFSTDLYSGQRRINTSPISNPLYKSTPTGQTYGLRTRNNAAIDPIQSMLDANQDSIIANLNPQPLTKWQNFSYKLKDLTKGVDWFNAANVALNFAVPQFIAGIENRANNKLKYTNDPIVMAMPKLKTNYNINPDLDYIRNEVTRVGRGYDNNTGSSQVENERKRQLMEWGINSANRLFADKENIETQLINQDRMNQYQAALNNIQRYENWNQGRMQFENDKIINRSNILGNAINASAAGITNGIQNAAYRRRDKELDAIQQRQDKESLIAAIAANPDIAKRYPQILKMLDDIINENLNNRYGGKHKIK